MPGYVTRSRALAPAAQTGIQHVAGRIAQHVEGIDAHENSEAGNDREPLVPHTVDPPVDIQKPAPSREGPLDPEAEKAHPRFRENRGAEVHAGQDDNQRHDVRQHGVHHDAHVGGAERARGLHVYVLLDRQHRAPHDTRPVAGKDYAERKDHDAAAEERVPDPVAVLRVKAHIGAAPNAKKTVATCSEHGQESDEKEDGRERHPDVHHALRDHVHAPSQVAADPADNDGQKSCDEDGPKTDQNCHLAANYHAAEEVLAEDIRAEPVRPVRRLQRVAKVGLRVWIACYPRREHRYSERKDENKRAESTQWLSPGKVQPAGEPATPDRRNLRFQRLEWYRLLSDRHAY